MKISRFMVAMFLACVLPALAANGERPIRKNIDMLTPQELVAYEHAVQILKDRSAENPYWFLSRDSG